MSSTPSRLVEIQRDGGVATVRMANDRSGNSLSNEMRIQPAAAFGEVAADETVRAIYLSGNGAAFCSGGDPRNLKTLTGPWGAHRRFRRLGEWLLPLLRIEKPAVEGLNALPEKRPARFSRQRNL